MATKTERIQKELERTQAKKREAARKAQALGAKLSTAARADDTRRKILVGSWAMERAERIADFDALMVRELDRVWLWRDDDRALFGFAPLEPEEKARREAASGKTARKPAKSAGGSETQANGNEVNADAANAA